jgi:protein-disulfide isomerase
MKFMTDENDKNEYFEIRIPKLVKGGFPLLLVLFLMLLSYFAGLMTSRLYATYQESQRVSDATAAFKQYAKQIKLDRNAFNECLDSGKYAQPVKTDMDAGTSLGVTGTPSFFINGRFIVGALDYSVFKTLIDQELSGNRTPLPEEEASGAAKIDVAKGHLPILGKDSAKVAIVEFSDFQCPFCESFFTNTYPQLKKDYLDTGKAQLAFRHYPLTSIHPNSEKAHQAAECANEQGKFWEYHDLLFKQQVDWVELPLVSTES